MKVVNRKKVRVRSIGKKGQVTAVACGNPSGQMQGRKHEEKAEEEGWRKSKGMAMYTCQSQ